MVVSDIDASVKDVWALVCGPWREGSGVRAGNIQCIVSHKTIHVPNSIDSVVLHKTVLSCIGPLPSSVYLGRH